MRNAKDIFFRFVSLVMLLLCMFFAALTGMKMANADELSWTWTAPISRTDGTAFDMATEGQGYMVWFNDVLEVDTNGDPLMLSEGANGISKVFPSYGQICIDVATVDKDGRIGPKHSAVHGITGGTCKEVLAPPGSVTNLTVNIIVSPPAP